MEKSRIIFLMIYILAYSSINLAQEISTQETKVNLKIKLKSYPLSDSSRVLLWIEKGWVNAKRIDKANSLIWHIIIYRFNGKNYPEVKTDGSRINISNKEGTYFITTSVVTFSFFPYEIVRGIQEYALDDINASFDPTEYGVTTRDFISNGEKQRLLAYEKDGWRYISIGSDNSDRVVGLIRMQNNLLENNNPARSTEGFDALGKNHFFWDSKLIYAEQIPGAVIANHKNALDLLTNKMAPELETLTWYNNPKFNSLHELRGKVIVLYFWATWCNWCLPAMNTLESLQAKYYDKGFVVIGVHHNKHKEQLLDKYLVENENIKFPICIAKEATIKKYFADNIPKYYIIGRNGEIIKSMLDSLPTEEEIIDLLK